MYLSPDLVVIVFFVFLVAPLGSGSRHPEQTGGCQDQHAHNQDFLHVLPSFSVHGEVA